MRTLLRDLGFGFLVGMVIPGIFLNMWNLMLNRTDKTIALTGPEPVRTEQIRTLTVSLPVLVQGADGVVTCMDMDTYLVGVVLAEMPVSFEEEALKAQAVVARTYARKAFVTGGKHGDGSICTDSACCQAFCAESAFLEAGGARTDVRKVRNAVKSTSGYVLQYGGELIEATYFSCSGGRTEDAQAVWGTDFPYLQAVSSPGEEDALYYTNTLTYSREEFLHRLGLAGPAGREITITDLTYTSGGGIESILICGRNFRGTELRKLLELPSTSLSIFLSAGEITITTRGYGHRVGMSQYGAEAMAVSGSSWKEILAHYYPGTELVCLQPERISPSV